jgi:hypothetical protein
MGNRDIHIAAEQAKDQQRQQIAPVDAHAFENVLENSYLDKAHQRSQQEPER